MTYTITRDEVAALDTLAHVLRTVDAVSTPTGISLETYTTEGDRASIGTWNGVIVVSIFSEDPWGNVYEDEHDGFDTLADAVKFAQDFSWGDLAP